MNHDAADLITIAVLQSASEANLLKSQLGSVGIKAYLEGEEAVSMAWHLAGAFGDIKLQVAAGDADDALTFIERRSLPAELEDKTAVATPESLERIHADVEPDEVLSEREKNANRAVRAAVFGLIVLGGLPIAGLGNFEKPIFGFAFFFWVLEGYAALLLLRVFFSKEKLTGRPRRNAKVAGWLTGSMLAIFGLVFAMAVHGPIHVHARDDLRKFHHPEALIGTWAGVMPGDEGETEFTFELKRDGTVHCWETGAHEIDCAGTWAYENWTFYVRYDRFLKGDSAWKDKIIGFPVEGFRGTEMFLVTERGKIRCVRRP